MKMIIMDRRAGRNPQRVDASHVAEHALADMMGVVEGHFVVVGSTRSVSPNPAQREGRVVEIIDIIMANHVVRRMADPNADSGRMQSPGVGDQAVLDRVMRHEFLVIGRRPE